MIQWKHTPEIVSPQSPVLVNAVKSQFLALLPKSVREVYLLVFEYAFVFCSIDGLCATVE